MTEALLSIRHLCTEFATDEGLPGALEAITRLRRRGKVPVVLLGVGAEVGARALKSGADVILPRPVSPESLVELLGSMVTTAFPSARCARCEGPTSG